MNSTVIPYVAEICLTCNLQWLMNMNIVHLLVLQHCLKHFFFLHNFSTQGSFPSVMVGELGGDSGATASIPDTAWRMEPCLISTTYCIYSQPHISTHDHDWILYVGNSFCLINPLPTPRIALFVGPLVMKFRKHHEWLAASGSPMATSQIYVFWQPLPPYGGRNGFLNYFLGISRWIFLYFPVIFF